MNKINFLPVFLFASIFLPKTYGQRVGIGTTTPHASAMLDVQSTNKGMLVPRIALTAANLATPVTAPADALLVYNTAIAGTGANGVVPGFYYWNSSTSRWNALKETSNSSSSVGFGSWGDCSTNNISEYNPVIDQTGDYGDFFGLSVCISGDYAIAGAYLDNVGANVDQGSASIYRYNGANWVLMNKITDATGAANDNFGKSVSISGNYAIVGADADDVGVNVDQGSASIYRYDGANWVLMKKITDAFGAANDNFGVSVSISGNYAIVGADSDDVGANISQGSASIYRYDGANWVLMNIITDATGAYNDRFGSSVSISGNYAIVGARNDDGVNANQGSASIYRYDGANWVLMNKITDPYNAADDNFGVSVSISGNYAIVGSSLADVSFKSNQGSASIYRYDGANWEFMSKITDPTGAIGDFFGASVSISGNYAIVGAYGADVGVNVNQGSASIFQRVGLGWQKLQYVTDPGGNPNDFFGISSAIDGTTKRFIIGADVYATGTGKVVFGKIN